MPRAATANRTTRARIRRAASIFTIVFLLISTGTPGVGLFIMGLYDTQWLPTLTGLLGLALYMLGVGCMATNLQEIKTGAYDQRLTQRKQTKQNQKNE